MMPTKLLYSKLGIQKKYTVVVVVQENTHTYILDQKLITRLLVYNLRITFQNIASMNVALHSHHVLLLKNRINRLP